MQAVAHLVPAPVEADVLERPAAQPAVHPVGEDALVGPAELPCPGEHAAAVDPDREAVGLAVLEGELLARHLGRAVERDGRRGRERLRDRPPATRPAAGARPASGSKAPSRTRVGRPASGADGVDAARAQEHERGAAAAAELQEVHRPEQVVLDELAAGGAPVHPREHARVRGGVHDRVDVRQALEVARQPQVGVPHLDAQVPQREPVHLAARSGEAVDPDERVTGARFDPGPGERRAHEAARAGDQDPHGSAGRARPRRSRRRCRAGSRRRPRPGSAASSCAGRCSTRCGRRRGSPRRTTTPAAARSAPRRGGTPRARCRSSPCLPRGCRPPRTAGSR